MPVFKLKLVIIISSESYIIARGGRLLHARAQSYSSSASNPSLRKHFSDTIQLLYGGMACKFFGIFITATSRDYLLELVPHSFKRERTPCIL